MGAAGRAGVPVEPERAQILVGEVTVVRAGVSQGREAEERANQVMHAASYVIELVLGDGPGSFAYLTSDLGHGYVDVNAGYRS